MSIKSEGGGNHFMRDFKYQICIFERTFAIANEIRSMCLARGSELGIAPSQFAVLINGEIAARDRKAPAASLFLGYDGARNDSFVELGSLLSDSIPILPAVEDLNGFSMKVPEPLIGVNGIAVKTRADKERVVSTLFENLQLLRADRRIFISYRRSESTAAAVQLYEELGERGFDPFLDTRSVRPSSDFQSELWHRMSDSDVVILLDTPGFRKNHWTALELAQANSTNVQILHLLWPGVAPDPSSAFSEFAQVEVSDFIGISALPDMTSVFTKTSLDRFCAEAERLRARALAARHAFIVDGVIDAARDAGSTAELQPERFITVRHGGAALALFPTVGVPNARRLQRFWDIVNRDFSGFEPAVVYDERGVLDDWRKHLGWLGSHLPIKTIENSSLFDWLKGRS